jgi:hypothetical protein
MLHKYCHMDSMLLSAPSNHAHEHELPTLTCGLSNGTAAFPKAHREVCSEDSTLLISTHGNQINWCRPLPGTLHSTQHTSPQPPTHSHILKAFHPAVQPSAASSRPICSPARPATRRPKSKDHSRQAAVTLGHRCTPQTSVALHGI